MHRPIVLLLLTASFTTLTAQSVVVPAANANVRGSTQLNSIIRNLNNPRTFMQGINASELAGIPLGARINGVSLRFQVFASNTASWPPADIQWNNYDIYVGPALPTASWTGNFMANFASPPVQARSGPMVLPAGVFTNTNPPTPLPNAWAEFYFDFQVPYQYLGGDLALLFSHPGSTDPNTALYPEVVVSSAATYGVGFSQTIYPAGTGGALSNFYVMRVHYGYGTGCPGTGGRVPNLVQSGNTTGGLGGPIYMTVGNCPANTAGVFAFGFGNSPIPLPNGCTLWLVPAATLLVVTNNNGIGQFTLTVPPAVTGGFNAQAVVLDAGGPGGYTASNAIQPRAF
jgi:hypothetical protein